MAHFWEMAVINEEIIAMLEKVHGVKSLEDPDVVVLGFDTTLTYEKLSKACHYIIRKQDTNRKRSQLWETDYIQILQLLITKML